MFLKECFALFCFMFCFVFVLGYKQLYEEMILLFLRDWNNHCSPCQFPVLIFRSSLTLVFVLWVVNSWQSSECELVFYCGEFALLWWWSYCMPSPTSLGPLCFFFFWEMTEHLVSCLLACLTLQKPVKQVSCSTHCALCKHLYLVANDSSAVLMILIESFWFHYN